MSKYDRFVGELSSRRRQNITRQLGRIFYAQLPEKRPIPLFSGMPSPDVFPFVEASVILADGRSIDIKVKDFSNV